MRKKCEKMFFLLILSLWKARVMSLLSFDVHHETSAIRAATRSGTMNICMSSRASVSLPSVAGFSLDRYLKQHLIDKQEGSALSIEFNPAVPSSTLDENKQYLLLVDLGVRAVCDIDLPYITNHSPFLKRLLRKMESAGEALTEEKFFYHHDMGIESVCTVGIARSPSCMYQRLELGRIVARTYGSNKPLEVMMIDSSRDTIVIDENMCKAIVGGMQMESFTMPSLKMKDQEETAAGGTPQGESQTPVTKKPVIQFVTAPSPAKLPIVYSAGDVIENEIKRQGPVDDMNSGRDELLTSGVALLKKQAESQMKFEAQEPKIDREDSYKDNCDESDDIPELGSKFKQFIDDPEDMVAAEKRKKKVSDLTAIMEANMAKSAQERWDATEGFQNRKPLSLNRENDDNEDNINDAGFERGILGSNDVETARKEIDREIIINEGTNIARALASLPPNVLNPVTYVNLIKTMAETRGWEYSEWTAEDMKELDCGAFHAVTQANPPGTDRLVRLRWRKPLTFSNEDNDSNNRREEKNNIPDIDKLFVRTTIADFAAQSDLSREILTTGDSQTKNDKIRGNSIDKINSKKPVVLVGKGVCFDTGGINVKTANSMKTMKHDMAGSSVALGLFHVLTHPVYTSSSLSTISSHPIECWLPIVENNVNTDAFRPDDVCKAVTGETIEIVHSDAEGRMLLADVLALASRRVKKPAFHGIEDTFTPSILLDFATLTGTCVSSLTNRYIGAFPNRKEMVEQCIQAGERSGERIWPFPVDDDLDDDLKSDVADILQCRQPTEGDHLYAAAFLKRFMNPGVPWVHFDLASAHRPGGLGHVSSAFTGSGVRAALELLNLVL